MPMAAGVTTRTTGLPGRGYQESARTLIGRPGASWACHSWHPAAWRTGWPAWRHRRAAADPGHYRRGGASGFKKLESASLPGVCHRTVTYSPATLPADTVAVDTVPSATYDPYVRR